MSLIAVRGRGGLYGVLHAGCARLSTFVREAVEPCGGGRSEEGPVSSGQSRSEAERLPKALANAASSGQCYSRSYSSGHTVNQ